MPVVGIRDMSVRSIQTSWPLSLSWLGFKWFHHCLPSFNIFLHSFPSNEKSFVAMKNGKKQKLKLIKHLMYRLMKAAIGKSIESRNLGKFKMMISEPVKKRWFPPETEVHQTRFGSLLQQCFTTVFTQTQLNLNNFDQTNDNTINYLKYITSYCTWQFQKSDADKNSLEIGGILLYRLILVI